MNSTTVARPVSFKNTVIAFRSKSDQELKRSKWLFRLFNYPLLVKALAAFTVWSLRIRLPIAKLIRSTIFTQFCGGETIEESKRVVDRLHHARIGSILDYSIEGKECDEDFERTKEEVIRIILTAKANPSIPYTSLKLTGICGSALLEKISSGGPLSAQEQAGLKALKERLESVFHTAHKTGVPVYIDAEESWIQPAIDELALEFMRKFNSEKAIVQTTLQMYRRDRLDYLKTLIATARRERFYIGIKLVRGAYWEKENARAAEKGYITPVHAGKKATDHDFDLAASLCIDNIDLVSLCAGTHNEESTLKIVNNMAAAGISNSDRRICFSQLYGMSDHISYNLAYAGYNVTKYLPYGPVKSVIPYLIRRAQENTSIAGQMGRELQMICIESKRRARRAGARE